MPGAITSHEELFETETLSAMAERFAQNVTDLPFTREFEAGERLTPDGDSVKWDQVTFSRGLSPVVGPEAPTKQAKKTDLKVRSAVLVDVQEHLDCTGRFLWALRNPGSTGLNARAKLAREIRNGVKRVMNTKELLCTKAAEGSLDLSAIPGSELNQTITYPVFALSALASWALSATAIRSSEINALKDSIMKKTGMRPERAIAHHNVEDFITGNDEISTFLDEGSLAARTLTSSFLDGGSEPRLGGINWRFTNAHYADDATPNTEVEFLTVDRAIVFPSPAATAEVLAMAEGLKAIPAGPVYAPTSDAGAIEGMTVLRRGMWAYAEVIANPYTIRVHMGWRGLPIVKVTNGITNYNTTP